MQILVVGMGLIGGSICKSIKAVTEHTVYGCDVRQDVLLLEQLAATLGFGFTLLGQRYIDPAGELVGFIPCALSMTEQY